MKIHITHEGYVMLPDGRYWVKVVTIVFQKAWKDYGPALEWVFEIVRGTHTGCHVNGRTNLKNSLGPTCKFGRWYFALTGVRLKLGDSPDTDSLIGKCCWAKITAFHSASGKPVNNIDLDPGDPPDSHEDS